MPIYEYQGLDTNGRTKKGFIDAENLKSAKIRLKKDGIYVTQIRDQTRTKSDKNRIRQAATAGGGKKVKIRDLALMTRQLATLIKANIPLVDALNAVAEQLENQTLSVALSDIKNMVNEGSSLHRALAKYPKIFDPIYISMCEAGELSGSLDIILMRLAEFQEAQNALRAKVRSALTYPIIMLVVTLGLLSFLFMFVIPKIVVVFESFPELELPLITQITITISDIFIGYWYVIGGLLGLIIFSFQRWKNSPEGRKKWDAISLKLPLFGEMNRMVAVSRFTRTLATLLNGGVPMLTALQIVRGVVDNEVVAKAIDEARSNISEGESIAAPLKKSGQFPPIVIHMISIGEKTGELENMLTRVSEAFEFQVKNKVEALTSLMGPVVLIVMGVVIGIIVFAVLVPMLELGNIGG